MCSVEKILSDVKTLLARQKQHEDTADSLVATTQSLYHRVFSMKQYGEDLNELNELARHRPRASLILGLVQENTQLRELRAENRELRASLSEHQGALELIMSKYREHMMQMMVSNRFGRSAANSSHLDDNAAIRRADMQSDKITEMVSVMRRAISLDDQTALHEQEIIARLRTENATLRRLVHADEATHSATADGGAGSKQHDMLITFSPAKNLLDQSIDATLLDQTAEDTTGTLVDECSGQPTDTLTPDTVSNVDVTVIDTSQDQMTKNNDEKSES